MKRLLASLLLMVFVNASKAQYTYTGIAEGLSNRNITCLMQDRFGLIWIGTENGLNIYDGYSFRQYFTYTAGWRLSSARITCLLEDSDGSTWVGTYTGLNHIDAARRYNTVIGGVSTQRITSIMQVKGQVFFGASDGCIYRVDGNKATRLFSMGKRCGLFGLAMDAKGYTYYHTDCEHNIRRLDPQFKHCPDFLFHDTLVSRFMLQGNTLLASTRGHNGLVRLSLPYLQKVADPALEKLNKAHPHAGSFFADNDGNTWAGYRNAMLYRVSRRDGSIEDFSSYFTHEYFGSRINCYMQDRQGLLWIGTDGGIVRIFRSAAQFSSYPLLSQKRVSTRGISTDTAGNIYVASNEGLFVINKADGSTRNHRFGENPLRNENSMMGLCWLDRQNLLIATINKGLQRFNLATQSFYPMVSGNGFNKDLLCVYKDRQGQLWIGTHWGLKRYDPARQQLIDFHDATHNKVLARSSIWQVTEIGNRIWAVTPQGLFCIDRKRGTQKWYHQYSKPALPVHDLYCMEPGDSGILWLGSRGAGILSLNPATSMVRSYSIENGLCNNVSYGIARDNGYLWISTDNGLSRFDTRTHSFTNFFESDGLADNEFNAISYYHAPGGPIIMGGIRGITIFDPRYIPVYSPRPRLLLTSLGAGDEETSGTAGLNTDSVQHIRLEAGNANLSLTIALTDYLHASANTYSYRIGGIDDGWNNLGTRNAIRISQLRPGSYELEVRGRNAAGMEAQNHLHILLDVDDYFYRKPLFLLAMAMLVFCTLYLFFHMRIRQLQRLQALRVKIASDLHDEVGSMLTRISILAELLKFRNRNSEEIEQIAQASKQATTTMSDVLWSIDSRNDKIENLVDRMREHAEALLLPLGIDVSFETQGMEQGQPLVMLMRQNILYIFKEAVNNIAKHAHATQVHILFSTRNGLFLQIKDNGTGEAKASAGSGQGISNMRMRAAEMGASLEIDTSTGYRITLNKK